MQKFYFSYVKSPGKLFNYFQLKQMNGDFYTKNRQTTMTLFNLTPDTEPRLLYYI